MSSVTLPPLGPARPGPRRRSFWRRAADGAMLTGGAMLVLVGFVGSLLPGHLGLPVLVVGLIVVLRSSRPARRHFIGLQRRHPRVVFPLRRLLRREPEVAPVFWQQVLRFERLVFPRSWRRAAHLRRRFLRRARRP